MPCQIAVAVDLADAGRAELARGADREFDALRRRRMARQEVGPLVLHRAGGLVGGIAAHQVEEARRGKGIVAGLADGAHADRVGLQLLLLREGGERALAGGERQLAGLAILQHVGDDAADDDRRARLVLPLHGVVGRDMAHLVRDHRRDFGGIVGERQQAARDIEIAARQREGVDRRAVQDGDAIGLRGIVGGGDAAPDDARQRLLQLVVMIDAAIARDDARMLLRRRCGPGSDRPAAGSERRQRSAADHRSLRATSCSRRGAAPPARASTAPRHRGLSLRSADCRS